MKRLRASLGARGFVSGSVCAVTTRTVLETAGTAVGNLPKDGMPITGPYHVATFGTSCVVVSQMSMIAATLNQHVHSATAVTSTSQLTNGITVGAPNAVA